MTNENDISDNKPRARYPLIFISHDTRDAALAEAFSKLLSSVSAGVLKSFRSSDKKGNQGIEYGVEWFPEIMKKLVAASDVVCLLTPNSLGRPWILYEAGVAKGKLDTPVHGLALGVPLQIASTGPFAQFQNSDDSEEALTQLVMQLVARIPNAEPDREVVRNQVSSFREKSLPLVTADLIESETEIEADTPSVAKIFEEVKVMFQDLPGRIERRLDPESKRRRRYAAQMMLDLAHHAGREMPPGVQLLIVAGQFKDDFPWLYDMASDIYRRLNVRPASAYDAIAMFEHTFSMTLRHPAFREFTYRSRDRIYDIDEMISLMREAIARLRDMPLPRPARATAAQAPKEENEKAGEPSKLEE